MLSGLPAWFEELLARATRQALASAMEGEGPRLRAHSTSQTARLLALAEAARHARCPLLVVTASEKQTRSIERDLRPMLSAGPPVLRLPRLEADPYRGLPAHAAVAARRVAVLDQLVQGEPVVVLLPVAALLQPVPDAGAVRGWSRRVATGETLALDALAREVVAAGYRVTEVVTSPGDFTRRGGLFDIWPPHEEQPLRVELWGDEVDTVRRFDAATQRTTERVEAFRWLPAREAPIDRETADRLLDRLIGRAREVLAAGPETDAGLARVLQETLAGVEGAVRLYREDLVPLEGLTECAVATWDAEAVAESLDRAWDDLEQAAKESAAGDLPPPAELYRSPREVGAVLESAVIELAELPLLDAPAAGGAAEKGRRLLDLSGRVPPRLEGRVERLAELLRPALDAGRPAVLLLSTRGRRDRVEELLEEQQMPHRAFGPEDDDPPLPGTVAVLQAELSEGVDLGEGGALLLSETDLFGAPPPPPPSRRRRGGEAFLSDLRDLSVGDPVIHVDHGVARYRGLERHRQTGDEMLALEYAGGDRLLVPVTRLDLIQKYSGGDRSLLPLDRLGGPGWERRRRRVGREVERIARDLLELYARRRTASAPAFDQQTSWQREFEQAFPHELTADQEASLADIKADLARGSPMDRLLCGDVGYGKTEVALRAAFAVVQQGWQVAVLVPTTVLAFQHQATFRARMAGWPVRVEMVSRLVPRAEARQILADTEAGQVDILIGTHRLLGGDVRFRRLGLLAVDEEQRFGVKHKEAIKKLSLGVHCLSMSATPIPRTLQMSLGGARDLSVIETPPSNRLSIQTHLAPFSESLIAAAIRNELRREGQVYFIRPKIEGLERTAALIQRLVPGARVAWAHGRMGEGRLERVMLEFVRGEAQVLVSTSIVENGLDIPRANTILIESAHHFGLSQLYQMRGRVGRSDQRAYAYLLIPSQRELTPEARKRLSTLVEFSELGAGFRIAAMDLEIRGAGEFLGTRQSGHIAAVGFEMYNQMLEGAVRRLRGEEVEQPPEPVTINLDLPAHLPEETIPDAGQRLALYKRLSAAESEDEIGALEVEAADRYGALPEAARRLFDLARLRVLAAEQGAVSLDWAGDGIVVRYGRRPRLDPERLIELLERDESVRMTAAGQVKLRVGDARADRVAAARVALRRLGEGIATR